MYFEHLFYHIKLTFRLTDALSSLMTSQLLQTKSLYSVRMCLSFALFIVFCHLKFEYKICEWISLGLFISRICNNKQLYKPLFHVVVSEA